MSRDRYTKIEEKLRGILQHERTRSAAPFLWLETAVELGFVLAALERNEELEALANEIMEAIDLEAMGDKLSKLNVALTWAKRHNKEIPPSAIGKFGVKFVAFGEDALARDDLEKAYKAFYISTKMMPDDPDGLYHMGVLVEKKGNWETAKKYFRKSFSIINGAPEERAQLYVSLCKKHDDNGALKFKKASPVHFFRNALWHVDAPNRVNGICTAKGAPKTFEETHYFLGASQLGGKTGERIIDFYQKRLTQDGRTARTVSCFVGGQFFENYFLQIANTDIEEGDHVIVLPWHNPKATGNIPATYDFETEIKLIMGMRSVCARRKAHFHLFIHPTLFTLKNPSEHELQMRADAIRDYDVGFAFENPELCYESRLAAALGRSGIEYHYLRDLLDRPHDMGEVFTDTHHFTPVFREKIASAMYAIVERNATSNATPRVDYDERDAKPIAVRYLKSVAQKHYFRNKDIINWLMEVRQPAFAGAEKIGSIVMNCNPFTNGHKYLISKAVEQVDALYIFVVEENLSKFPFQDRIRLIREGVAEWGDKIAVVPSGKFIISTFSFPGYFAKEEVIEPADSTTDVLIFGSIIAPELNITHRFIGEEPNCITTNAYNSTMKYLLPDLGIQLLETPRVANSAGMPISASAVRKALLTNDHAAIRPIVPETTYRYLVESGLLK